MTDQERAALLAWLDVQIEIAKLFKHINLLQISALTPTSKLDALLDVSQEEGHIDAYSKVKVHLESEATHDDA